MGKWARCHDCGAKTRKTYKIIQYRRLDINSRKLTAFVKRVCRKCLPWYERHKTPNSRR